MVNKEVVAGQLAKALIESKHGAPHPIPDHLREDMFDNLWEAFRVARRMRWFWGSTMLMMLMDELNDGEADRRIEERKGGMR